jgi:adenylosuccinate lyase
MRELWSEQRKFEIWLEIETLACEAMAEIGQIPPTDAAEIRQRARFSISEINEIEKRTNHDVIAFLENVATSVGPAARWIHQGLTSSDILDTTLAVQLSRQAGSRWNTSANCGALWPTRRACEAPMLAGAMAFTPSQSISG